MIVHCPSCKTKLDLTLADGSRPAPASDSPLTAAALRDVFEFMQFVGPVRKRTVELYREYDLIRIEHEWTELSGNAFSRALSRNGASRWRDSTGRGVKIPELGPDAKPAGEAASRARVSERQAYQQALVDHSTDRVLSADEVARRRQEYARTGPVLTAGGWQAEDLPFEMDFTN